MSERGIGIAGLDHVQLAMPRGEEALARMFYAGLLGLREVRKPRALAGRGGAWFVAPGAAVHLGVEEPFRPARKAHAAFVVDDLEVARQRLATAGVETEPDPTAGLIRRCYVSDPFGNRLELVDGRDAGFSARRPDRHPAARPRREPRSPAG